jgi:Ankyrin repeats (3 copies)
MIHFFKTIFPIFILILFLSVESSNGYSDIDVKLFNAAQNGNIEKITALLSQGGDINVRLGVDQWTPLMTASREGNLEAVELLLGEGADPNIRDTRFNKNAYHWGLQSGHRDVARLLLENGASREFKKPSQFFGRGISMVAFLTLAILTVSVWVLYFLAVVPFLKSNGIVPTAFFMNWRFRSELEGYAQLRQAKGKSLTVYHILKYSYYCIYIVVILFIITVFKTCQDGQEKSQYEILKDWHDTNLERRLNE